MDVVYIIGNGFDLQIGLPTRYSDFYKYYTSIESKSESIKKLKEAIKEKPKDWSDLEMALAEYTTKTASVQEYCEVYDDLQQSLRDYILKVDEMMKAGELTLNADSKTLEIGFTYPENMYGSDEAYTIEGELLRFAPGLLQGQSSYDLNIITFNYTHVIEQYLKDAIEDPSSHYPRIIHSVLHVHREVLKNQSIWVGADNDEQIQNISYRIDPNIQYRLIKPKIITALSRRMVSDAMRLIKTAKVLVIFGASLGPSDETWSKLVAEQINKGAVTLLFVFNGNSYPSDNAKLIDKIKYREEFVEKMNLYGVKIVDDTKIYVEINSSIFTNGTPNNHDNNLDMVLEKLKQK